MAAGAPSAFAAPATKVRVGERAVVTGIDASAGGRSALIGEGDGAVKLLVGRGPRMGAASRVDEADERTASSRAAVLVSPGGVVVGTWMRFDGTVDQPSSDGQEIVCCDQVRAAVRGSGGRMVTQSLSRKGKPATPAVPFSVGGSRVGLAWIRDGSEVQVAITGRASRFGPTRTIVRTNGTLPLAILDARVARGRITVTWLEEVYPGPSARIRESNGTPSGSFGKPRTLLSLPSADFEVPNFPEDLPWGLARTDRRGGQVVAVPQEYDGDNGLRVATRPFGRPFGRPKELEGNRGDEVLLQDLAADRDGRALVAWTSEAASSRTAVRYSWSATGDRFTRARGLITLPAKFFDTRVAATFTATRRPVVTVAAQAGERVRISVATGSPGRPLGRLGLVAEAAVQSPVLSDAGRGGGALAGWVDEDSSAAATIAVLGR